MLTAYFDQSCPICAFAMFLDEMNYYNRLLEYIELLQ